MSHSMIFSVSTLFACALLAGCDAPPSDQARLETAGLQLSTDVLADTDVAQMAYVATEVDCGDGTPIAPPISFQATEDLVDAFLPGGSPGLENAPLDQGSQHIFSDHFFWLPEGCYDVTIQPLDAAGDPSVDCAAGHRANVPVFDGQVTEILLISQCDGEPFGGLDVIGVLNHPPQILNVTYEPSKFVCGGEVEICIEAMDPDGDPMTIDWGDSPVAETSRTPTATGMVFCASFELPEPGDYTFNATVYDLGWAGDRLVTMERLLAAQGDPRESRDEVAFPIHALSPDACIEACANCSP